MGPLPAFPAAATGKPLANKPSLADRAPEAIRPLIFALTLLAATLSGSASHAQAGPFAGMAGNWVGGGTVTLDDGSVERIRCRASDAVGAGGASLNMTLVCASDSYKFDLRGSVISERGALSGTWSESTRGVTGILRGRGGSGNFQVIATASGFTAQLSVTTRGNRQAIVINADSGFRGAGITMSRY